MSHKKDGEEIVTAKCATKTNAEKQNRLLDFIHNTEELKFLNKIINN